MVGFKERCSSLGAGPTGAEVRRAHQTYPIPNSSLLFAMNLDPDNKTFWTGDLGNGTVSHIDIATGNILGQFNSSPSTGLAGLSIVGGIVVSSDPLITATGKTKNWPPGCETVATFTDPDTAATASEYSASVDWGDGRVSNEATIIQTGPGSFRVKACHGYKTHSTWTAKTTITDVDNSSNTATASSTLTS
jgi:hypothetical protein